MNILNGNLKTLWLNLNLLNSWGVKVKTIKKILVKGMLKSRAICENMSYLGSENKISKVHDQTAIQEKLHDCVFWTSGSP